MHRATDLFEKRNLVACDIPHDLEVELNFTSVSNSLKISTLNFEAKHGAVNAREKLLGRICSPRQWGIY